MRTFQQNMLEPEDTLEKDVSVIVRLAYLIGFNDQTSKGNREENTANELKKRIFTAFLDAGWQPPKYTTESEPRKPGDDS